jgi:hypothetical protein
MLQHFDRNLSRSDRESCLSSLSPNWLSHRSRCRKDHALATLKAPSEHFIHTPQLIYEVHYSMLETHERKEENQDQRDTLTHTSGGGEEEEEEKFVRSA